MLRAADAASGVIEYAPGTAPLLMAQHLHNNVPSFSTHHDTIKHTHATAAPPHPLTPQIRQVDKPRWIRHMLSKVLANAKGIISQPANTLIWQAVQIYVPCKVYDLV
jgi:hypothetical protein